MKKIKLNEKYQLLFTSNTRYYIIVGGRGSGKSFSLNVFLSMLTYQPEEKVLFTRKTLTSAYISIIPEFQDKIELMGAGKNFDIKSTEITNKDTGSSIIFKGIQSGSKDNTANLKSIQGVTAFVLDEAEELTDERTFDTIDLSVRKKGVQNRVILVMNPTTKEHWVYKRFFEATGVNTDFTGVKGDVTYIHTTYLDNIKNLAESFINRAEQIKRTNPERYKHVMLGGWLEKSEGVIFTNWEVGDYVASDYEIYGQDFGFSVDPTTLIRMNADKDKKIIYVQECFYLPKLSTNEIFELNRKYAGKKLIIADSAEPRLIAELEALGNNIEGAEKGQGSVTAGISQIQDYKIVVDPDSLNLIKELNYYAWSDRKSGTPIDAHNHLIDALRYAARHYLSSEPEGDWF